MWIYGTIILIVLIAYVYYVFDKNGTNQKGVDINHIIKICPRGSNNIPGMRSSKRYKK